MCQCVGRCSLYILASPYPSLAALQCNSLKGFLTRQAATGQHIVKELGGVKGCDGVWGWGCCALCRQLPLPSVKRRFVFSPCSHKSAWHGSEPECQVQRSGGWQRRVCVSLVFYLCEDRFEYQTWERGQYEVRLCPFWKKKQHISKLTYEKLNSQVLKKHLLFV